MKATHIFLISALTTAGLLSSGCAKKRVAATTVPEPPRQAEAVPAKPAASETSRPSPAPARSEPAAAVTRGPDAATRRRIDELLAKIEDAYFDYNRHSLRADAVQALTKDSTELRDILKQYPDYKMTIEGHCDERGSAEYNIALGDARARAARDYLVQVGIPDAQFNIMSYGKEKPVCTETTEDCWQKNRRVHIVAAAR
jgi:peptidoglycan-associated lipoprotein